MVFTDLRVTKQVTQNVPCAEPAVEVGAVAAGGAAVVDVD